ncbi:tRNA (cytosine(32)/uridine(32)-2'-O)-methyltransferase TrmJ [Marinibactrum halimedae]|uniref:tRNA (cytidine/uridine-2'-O-)-methyltransferase TrmJ n=1 Tax=Marinibactrum halimedae TaxID=1444977 RepID=A0AA37WPJ8_9GAMM|nr:tRNA (cytosine(32)/uridine(32)-2'-O)-methyltransferase TrmJ [Marinibactrum halimedae]MCD9458439.1 tRNA (cytosine(32)/uridine(32)-2'-O)-methyltransferase TrmJ [Marinibactrum halimedae]GLS26137.1 tRNA (cytidine/uridine-2'-O-)-methyltransferase TrmJ [Marinibactrum halimedae]
MSTVKPNNDPEQFHRVRIVLVNTTHPGNIGAAARAMKNMGLSQLYLVAPKQFPAEEAVWRAAGAGEILDSAVVVETLDEAIKDCGLVVGTSARERRIPWPLLTPKECGDRAWAETSEHDVAIVFGREDRGLTNEELHKCNYHVHIPANPEYSALNLGTAVQVVAYEFRMSALAAMSGKPVHFDDWDVPPAKNEAVESYFEHLHGTLEHIGFLEPSNPRQTMTRLRRLYNRARLDEMEINILRGILTATQNYVYHTDKKIAELEARLSEKVESEQDTSGHLKH